MLRKYPHISLPAGIVTERKLDATLDSYRSRRDVTYVGSETKGERSREWGERGRGST